MMSLRKSNDSRRVSLSLVRRGGAATGTGGSSVMRCDWSPVESRTSEARAPRPGDAPCTPYRRGILPFPVPSAHHRQPTAYTSCPLLHRCNPEYMPLERRQEHMSTDNMLSPPQNEANFPKQQTNLVFWWRLALMFSLRTKLHSSLK